MRFTKPHPPIPLAGDPLLRDLIGAWLFSERGGTTARNVADRSGDASLASGASWGASPWGACLSGAGGTNDYADAGDWSPADLGTSDYTLHLQCKVNTFSAASGVLVKDTFAGAGNGLYVYEAVVGTNRFYFWTGSATTFTTSAVAKQWYCLTAVRSGTGSSQVQLYLDGVPVATCTDSRTLSNSHPLRFLSPADASLYRCDGDIGAVLIWRRALSASEVQAVCQDAFRPWRRTSLIPPLGFEVAVTTTITVSETFTVSDVAAVEATLSATDAFTFTESASLSVLVTATEAFTASDAVAGLSVLVTATDAFTFSEDTILDNGTTAPWTVSVVISTPDGWHDPEFTHVSDT